MFEQFHAAGYPVFGLYPISNDGSCGCGNAQCIGAGKHPMMAGWSNAQLMSPAKFKNSAMYGAFRSGYGVLVRGLLVIDCDPRNGGTASMERLLNDYPELHQCGLVVETGRGDGGTHWYFRLESGAQYKQQLDQYPGLDFKTTGYTVGPGSKHASGGTYHVQRGSPHDLTPAPPALMEALLCHDRYTADLDGSRVEVSLNHCIELLHAIDDDHMVNDYLCWLEVGMALHNATNGHADALAAWQEWSKPYPKYDPAQVAAKWASFKSGEGGFGYGTLRLHAMRCGWVPEGEDFDVSPELAERCRKIFEDAPAVLQIERDQATAPAPTVTTDLIPSGMDLASPPGFVGEVCSWINDQCATPRTQIATLAALVTMGGIYGSNYVDDRARPATANLMGFGIAGSGSGKNAIYTAVNTLYAHAGMGAKLCRKIKSEQEIYRNIIHEGAALYSTDEIGLELQKIVASAESGATYMMGVLGTLMNLYSNAGGSIPMGGDEGRDFRAMVGKRIAQLESENYEGDATLRDQELARLRPMLDITVLNKPFVNMFGLATPETFDAFVTPERVMEGFIGRSLIARERVDVPPLKPNFAPRPMDARTSSRIGLLSKEFADPVPVRTTADAEQLMAALGHHFYQKARAWEETNGMHPLALRAPELIAKVSFILAIATRERTLEHVQWAAAYVQRDLDEKVAMIMGGDKNTPEQKRLAARLATLMDKSEGMTARMLARKSKHAEVAVKATLGKMVEEGKVIESKEDGKTVYRISHTASE